MTIYMHKDALYHAVGIMRYSTWWMV